MPEFKAPWEMTPQEQQELLMKLWHDGGRRPHVSQIDSIVWWGWPRRHGAAPAVTQAPKPSWRAWPVNHSGGALDVTASSPEGAAEEMARIVDIKEQTRSPCQRVSVQDGDVVRVFSVVTSYKGDQLVYTAGQVAEHQLGEAR